MAKFKPQKAETPKPGPTPTKENVEIQQTSESPALVITWLHGGEPDLKIVPRLTKEYPEGGKVSVIAIGKKGFVIHDHKGMRRIHFED